MKSIATKLHNALDSFAFGVREGPRTLGHASPKDALECDLAFRAPRWSDPRLSPCWPIIEALESFIDEELE